jgi:DNA-binding MurR/RpiR family transcriptional regulator
LSTISVNDEATLTRATELISCAECVYVVGIGQGAYLAEIFLHQLAILGVRAEGGHREIAPIIGRVERLTEDDLLVAIALWRYPKILQGLLQANRSAPTIVLTDTRASVSLDSADVVLLGATGSAFLTHSLTSMQSLITLISSGVADRNREAAATTLASVEAFYQSVEYLGH